MPRLSELAIHVEGRLIDIDEHRRRAGQRHRLAGRAERKGRAEHGIAAADALRHQHHQQRIGAARAAHDMPAPQNAASSASSCATSGPLMNWQWASTRADRLVDRLAEPAALRGDVDEGNGFWTHVLVHGAFEDCARLEHDQPTTRRGPLRAAADAAGLAGFRGNGSRSRGWPRPRRRSPRARRRCARHRGRRSIRRATARHGRPADAASNSCRPA